jgi:hypothetical protein
MSFPHNEIIKTRKPHKCHGCENAIPAGTTDIDRQTNVFDGAIYSIYFCPECQRFEEENCHKCRDCYENECAFPGYIRDCQEEKRIK